MTRDIQRYSNYDEATKHIDGIQNRETRAFVQYGIATVMTGRRIPEERLPIAPIDLRYLCDVLEAMYANKVALELILQGRHSELEMFGTDS